MNESDLREAAESLRRTARFTRASRCTGWLTTAMELEAAAIKREAEADALASA